MTGEGAKDGGARKAGREAERRRAEAPAPRRGDPRVFPPLQVLWTGEHEVAVEKPAGLSSERPETASRDAAPSDSVIARARLQFAWPDAQLPHRLDRPTSGVLVVSADRSRAAHHAREIQEGRWAKWYLARLSAKDARPELLGTHRRYLRREGRIARCVRSGGDPSSLEILAIERATDRAADAHALIRLHTGRYHQIRAMLADLGAPLLGDVAYGGAAERPELELIATALRINRIGGAVRILSPTPRSVAAGLVQRLEACLHEASRDEA